MSQLHAQKIQEMMSKKLEELGALVEMHMEETGDASEDSQKVFMRAGIEDIHSRIRGIEESDLKAPTEGNNYLNAFNALDDYGEAGEDAALFATTVMMTRPDGVLTILMCANNKDEAGEKALDYARTRLGLADRPMELGLIKALSWIEVIQLSTEI